MADLGKLLAGRKLRGPVEPLDPNDVVYRDGDGKLLASGVWVF